MGKGGNRSRRRRGTFFLILCGVICGISALWAAFSLIGRVAPDSVIPHTAALRLSVPHPARFIDGIMAHESLDAILAVPEIAPAAPLFKALEESSLLKKPLARFAARGSLELAILPSESDAAGIFAAAWDMGFCSPLLRIIPLFAGFVQVPNLYYVQAGGNSRFEYRVNGKTFFIGPFRNILVITDSPAVFESRSIKFEHSRTAYQRIRPSSYDAAMTLSPEFISGLLSDQDTGMASVMDTIDFSSPVEAGLSLFPHKVELHLMASASSRDAALERLIEQRSSAPGMAEYLPAAVQYATILSAGTLEGLYQAALVFSGAALEESMKQTDSSARALLGLRLDDILYSWTGNEFAVFGMEGRPHPVYAIAIADERRRQEVFDKAFKSIVLNENVRLNLDGTRLPRIEIPGYLQSLLRRWNLFLPSPYYVVHGNYLLASESAETLLAALRAMQRNEVLPRTAQWRNIAGGKSASSAFSVYYSLDISLPFFLRAHTALSGFVGVYRQGLLRMSFDKGLVDLSLALIPGSGGGVTLVNGYPLDIGGRASNRVYGSGRGADSRILLTRGNSALSLNPADNTIRELSGQGQQWFIPAVNAAAAHSAEGWVVSERGRVTLVNGDMETARGFPALTGLRLSAPPAAHEGTLYLCDEDGKVYTVDREGTISAWESSFPAALRSPPSFLTVHSRGAGSTRTYAAVYPKRFFGEIWLLDAKGRTFPSWPVPVSGIGFGSPLLFTHNNSVYIAFVTQAGEFSLYDENAHSLPHFPLALEGVFYQQAVFDGEYLWLVADNGVLFRVSLAGEILYQRIPGFSVKEEGYITVFNHDGANGPSVFITGEGNALHAYSRRFRSLEGFPLPVWGRPLFIEAAGGGKPEIIGMGMDNRLYRWQLKATRGTP